MAYQVPKQWSHGDRINTVEMQKYSDGENAINGVLPSLQYNWATPFSLYEDEQEIFVVHRRQFLVYMSTGVIKDISGVNADVSLSSDSTFNSYDIDSIPWIVYGAVYRVQGCSVCMEDDLGA